MSSFFTHQQWYLLLMEAWSSPILESRASSFAMSNGLRPPCEETFLRMFQKGTVWSQTSLILFYVRSLGRLRNLSCSAMPCLCPIVCKDTARAIAYTCANRRTNNAGRKSCIGILTIKHFQNAFNGYPLRSSLMIVEKADLGMFNSHHKAFQS